MSHNIGRPTAIDHAAVQKLEEAFRQGFTISKACQLSGVSRSTYYDHISVDKVFSDKMTLAQEWPNEVARQVLVKAIKAGDLQTSKWWLERKAKIEFDPKSIPLPVAERENSSLDLLRAIGTSLKEIYKDFPPNDPFSPDCIGTSLATVS